MANQQAGETTNKERITSGLLVGREPHEPTFTRAGAELWVTVRGKDGSRCFDVAAARAGQPAGRALRGYVETISGPAQAWFSKDGKLAFVGSQKVAQIDVFETNAGANRPQCAAAAEDGIRAPSLAGQPGGLVDRLGMQTRLMPFAFAAASFLLE